MRLLVLAAAFPASAFAQTVTERVLVQDLFMELNPLSISENVEYCGYIGWDAKGNLIATQATRGREGSCMPDDPVEIKVLTASYHTHGTYSADYYNEMPSGDDMEGDEAEGIDGWVATPGGRLWYVDSGDMVASQVCGLDCLPADPDFVAGDMGVIAESYSYRDLVRKLAE